ncbi:MAG: DUF2946 domain-containing protein [Betaproteobacteria bacterium]|jgi:hypothetical protein
MSRFAQRPFVWLALMAMLALAVLPSVSHALAFARGGSSAWAEVCTPQGMRMVAVDAGRQTDSGAPMQAAAMLEHCALCALGGGAPALPASETAALRLLTGSHILPWLFLHAPRTLHAWRSAQPRGPPSVS